MKAIVFEKYGSPDVLELREIETPTPKHDEVLIKVHATSVNSWDWDWLTGRPYIYRLLFGLLKPRIRVLGCDVAGEVVSTGKSVTSLQAADEVFGDLSQGNWGCFAEYVCAKENALIKKPVDLTFEQAASIPQAGLLALQALRYRGQIRKGQKVLINGAGGGVGTFAIQIAKYFGAEVTAVDKTNKLEMMKLLGADHVIDYTKEDYTNNGQQYDLIVDTVAARSIFDYKRALTADGTFVMVGGSPSSILQTALLGSLVTKFGKKKIGLLLHKPNEGLKDMITLFQTGKVIPVIGRCFKLSEVPDALRLQGEANAKGKIVINVPG